MSNNDGAAALVIGAFLLFGAFLGYPLLAESTSNACVALERHRLGAFAADIDHGRAAEMTAAKAFPDAPAQVGCSLIYWQMIVDAGSADRRPGHTRG